MADLVASTTEFAAELTTLSTYSHATLSPPLQARRASSSVEANVAVAAISATVRRSNASASIPPYRPAATIGTRPDTAIIETANVSPVSS